MLTRSNGEQLFTFPIDSILAVAQPARTQLDLQVPCFSSRSLGWISQEHT